MVLKLGQFWKYIKTTLEVLKCDGEGWRESVGPIVWKVRYYKQTRRRGTSYIHWNKGRICHILHRRCLLKHVIEGEPKGMERQVRRCMHLFDEPEEMRQYWKLKQEALDHTNWRIHFRRGYWPVTSQTAWWWCKIKVT